MRVPQLTHKTDRRVDPGSLAAALNWDKLADPGQGWNGVQIRISDLVNAEGVVTKPLGTQGPRYDLPLGGAGSGNWAHLGRPGQRGGSAPREAGMTIGKGHDWLQRYKATTGRDHPYKAVADQWKVELAAARKVVKQHQGKAKTAEAVRAAFAEIEDQYKTQHAKDMETLNARLDELKQKSESINESLKNVPYDDFDRRTSLYVDANKVYQEIAGIEARIAVHERAINAEARELLYVDDPTQIQVTWGSRFGKNDPRRAAIEDGVAECQKMISANIDIDPSARLTVRKGGAGRARADAEGQGVSITTHSSTQTVIHEIGHWVENNAPGLRDRIFRFYEQRTQREPLVSLSQATGQAYGWNERTRVDRFVNPYMGKDYVNRRTGKRYGTEILSMGLEMFYSEPLRLAREDPEYFDFVFAAIRGNE